MELSHPHPHFPSSHNPDRLVQSRSLWRRNRSGVSSERKGESNADQEIHFCCAGVFQKGKLQQRFRDCCRVEFGCGGQTEKDVEGVAEKVLGGLGTVERAGI